MANRRVVVKLSGEALIKEQNSAALASQANSFNDGLIDRIVSEMLRASDNGVGVFVVVGAGNFWRGRNSKPDMDRVKSDQMGMLGTIMNAIYISETIKRRGRDSIVMTPFAVGSFTEPYSKESAIAYMQKGSIIINGGGTGLPYFSTDTVTALRAAELDADCALYAKNIDGVYAEDPRKNPNAKRYKTISYKDIINNNLNAVDLAAMCISQEAGTPSLCFPLDEPESVYRACMGDTSFGTLIGMGDIKSEY